MLRHKLYEQHTCSINQAIQSTNMQTSGFANAPVTQVLVFWVVAASVFATVSDTKYYFHLQIDPHLLQWRQFWRLLIWQTCYTNSTEVLFAAMTFYHLRVVVRLWGCRKFAVSLQIVSIVG